MRFVSLKWSALAAAIAGTATITLLTFLATENTLQAAFTAQRTLTAKRLAQTLDGLYRQWTQSTEQLVGVLVSSRRIRPGDTETLQQELERNRGLLQFDAGVKAIHIFHHPGDGVTNVPAEAKPPPAVVSVVDLVRTTLAPEHQTYCDREHCVHYTVLPFADPKTERVDVFAVAFSIVDLLQSFRAVSGADVLLIGPGGELGNRRVGANSEAVAIDPHRLSLPNGYRVVAMIDSGYEREAISRVRAQMIGVAIFGYALLAALLLVILWGPLTRLRRVTGNLHLLIEGRAADLRQAISGHKRPVDNEVSLLERRTLALAHDFERLKSAEQLALEHQVARQVAERYSAAKSRFVSFLSHEIRTPLSTIIALARLLRGEGKGRGRGRYVAMINSAAKVLISAVDEVLDISQIEAGLDKPVPRPINLVELMREVMDIAVAAAAEKDLVFRVEMVGVDPYVVVDARRLKHALLNLCANAVKFTSRGEVRVTITALAETATAGVPKSRLQFLVADTGPGIPEAHLGTIFEAFDRGDPSTARGQDGYGLGTAIAHQFVKVLGGELELRSRPGEGTIVWFEIDAERWSPGRSDPDVPLWFIRAQGDKDDTPPGFVALRRDEPLETQEALPALIAVDGELEDRAVAQTIERLTDRQTGILEVPLFWVAAPAREEQTPPIAKRIRLLFIGDRELLARIAFSVAVRPPSAQGRGLSVLVAEDDGINRYVIESTLRASGMRVDAVDSGTAALERLASGRYDWAILDFDLPGIDGIAIAEQARQKREDRPRIVICSADATTAFAERCLAAGVDLYLPKPIDPDDLINRLCASDTGTEPLAAAKLPRPGELLDETRIGRLRHHGRAFCERVVCEFEEASRKDLAMLTQAGARGDRDAVAFTLHHLRSSALSVGASLLADRCARSIEEVRRGAAKDYTFTEVYGLVTESAAALRESLEAEGTSAASTRS